MTDQEWGKLLDLAYRKARAEAEGKTFILKEETRNKIIAIRTALGDRKQGFTVGLDRALNRVDIEIRDHVLDSQKDGLKEVFSQADFFGIDARPDGTVCVQLCILDACMVLK